MFFCCFFLWFFLFCFVLFLLLLFVCFFYNKNSEALAQVAQRGGGHPVPGDIQGQAGGALST